MKIRSIGVCLKPDQPQASEMVSGLIDWAEGRSLEVLIDEDAALGLEHKATPREELCARVDLIIVIGGDGTLLAVARSAGTRRVPILGINLGSLGFLTEINRDEMEACLERVVQGDLVIEPRMRLEVQVMRDGREVGRSQALNDAVVARSGALSRMVDLVAYADGVKVTTYTADGLIISTPTGSTAYSLSAGGPLLMPGLEAFVLTPICPHSLTQRPIVLPQQTEIAVDVQLVRGGQITLTVDGQEEFELCHGDRVVTRRSPYPVEIVASPFRNRFEILHTKLRWGQR
jgi:NAD+ kinase